MTTTIIYSKKDARINQIENNNKMSFDSIIMVKFVKTKVAKEDFYGTKKNNKNLEC